MKFRYEADMIEPLTDQIPQMINSKNPYRVFLECVGSPGVADIVFACFDDYAIENRRKFNLWPLVRTVDVRIMYCLNPKKPLELNEIVRKCGYSVSYIRSALSFLLNNDYVNKVENGYVKSNYFVPVIKDIVAIEVKKDDWIRGIKQARHYMIFANRVYLAIDKANSSRLSSYVDRLQSQDIGIITVDARDSSVDILSKPKKRKPFSVVEHALVGERLWSVLRYDNSVGCFAIPCKNNWNTSSFQ